MNEQDETMMRLSKRMAHLGLCSRREADTYIEKGWVLVNGKPAILGQKVSLKDRIDLQEKAHHAQTEKLTIIINKPVAYVSAQAEKDHQPAIVLVTRENFWPEDQRPPKMSLKGFAPAGRLDIDSTGLLVLTQDGRIAKHLIGEDSQIEKEYLVRVTGTLKPDGLAKLNHGLSLDGKVLLPAKVTWQNKDQLRFVLKEGKKRQIRRMCELVGLTVVGLKRIRMGKVVLGDLPQGKWRVLRPNERF